MNRLVVFVVALIAGVLIFRACQDNLRNFDPAEVARSETAMWKAYYADDHQRLAVNLVMLLHNQYGMSLFKAKEIGAELAAASMSFRRASVSYEEVALPGLERAYTLIKKNTGARFDPKAAARAELKWWVSRRTPGRSAPENVGKDIASLYAILYGDDDPAFLKAGILRAEAAELRDAGGESADWPRVEQLLAQSYRVLRDAL